MKRWWNLLNTVVDVLDIQLFQVHLGDQTLLEIVAIKIPQKFKLLQLLPHLISLKSKFVNIVLLLFAFEHEVLLVSIVQFVEIALPFDRLGEVLNKLLLTLNSFSLLLGLFELLFDHFNSLFVFGQGIVIELEVLLKLLESLQFVVNFTIFKLLCHHVPDSFLGFNLLQ